MQNPPSDTESVDVQIGPPEVPSDHVQEVCGAQEGSEWGSEHLLDAISNLLVLSELNPLSLVYNLFSDSELLPRSLAVSN